MGNFSTVVELTPKMVKTTTSGIKHKLGTRGVTADGRVYRYSYSGAALTVGVPVQTKALYLLDQDTAYTAPINDTETISTTWRSFTVETETATGEITANEYKDGYVRVASSTVSGTAGQLIRIKSNTASATSSTDSLGSTMTVTFADDDEPAVSIDTGAVTTLHHNPYYGVIANAGGAAPLPGITVGVPNVAVSSGYYFWAQTWGACAVLQDLTLVTGGLAVQSTSTSDGISLVGVRTSTNSTFLSAGDTDADAGIGFINAVAATRPTIGWVMSSPGTDDKYALIFLTISP
jgi:hypothetical protein